MNKIEKMIDERESWGTLHPLAAEQVEIDLDGGVNMSYPKFSKVSKNNGVVLE